MKAPQETAVSRTRNWRHTHQVFQPYGKVVIKMVSLQSHNSAQHSDNSTRERERPFIITNYLLNTNAYLTQFQRKETTQRTAVFCRLPYDGSSASPKRVIHKVRPITSSRIFQRPLVSLKYAQKIDNGRIACVTVVAALLDSTP
jgi:hypothetical protein